MYKKQARFYNAMYSGFEKGWFAGRVDGKEKRQKRALNQSINADHNTGINNQLAEALTNFFRSASDDMTSIRLSPENEEDND